MIPNLVFTHKNKVNTGWFLASPLQKWLSFQKHIKGYIRWPRLSKCYLKTKHNQSSVFFNVINTIFSQRFAVCKHIQICCWIFFTWDVAKFCLWSQFIVGIESHFFRVIWHLVCLDPPIIFWEASEKFTHVSLQSMFLYTHLKLNITYFSLHSSHRLGSVILVVLLQQVICQFKHILYAIN